MSALGFFENAIASGMVPEPNQLYRDLNQAFIDEQWENTTARYTVDEQKMVDGGFPAFEFDSIEVWINYVIGQVSSSAKNGDDFRQLAFRSIEHPCVRGRYYYFEDNYWISTFTDEHDSIAKTAVVRRCNNFMRIVDPENGAIFSIPCVVEYDMSSPSVQVSRYVLTPNNHAVVMVQGNADTLRLFKTNTRYILGGRPFKLYGYQNAILDDLSSPMPTLLYLDLYLDELHDKDDLTKQLADNGVYDYQVKINSKDMILPPESTGVLTADVTLNGIEVQRELVWGTSDFRVVSIDENGRYQVNGKIGETATINVGILGNTDVLASIRFQIADSQSIAPEISIDPSFDHIREYQTIDFNVLAFYGGQEYKPDAVELSLSENDVVTSNDYLSIDETDNGYKITCLKRTKIPQMLYISVSNQTPIFTASTSQAIQITSMLG